MSSDSRHSLAYSIASQIRELASQVAATVNSENPLANESVCEAHTELALAIEELIKYLQPEDNAVDTSSPNTVVGNITADDGDASKHCLGRNSALGTKGFAEGVEIINKLKARERVQEKYCTCPPIDMHRAVGYQARQSCADCGKDIQPESKKDQEAVPTDKKSDDAQWVQAGNKRSYPRKMWDQMLDGQKPVCPPPKLLIHACAYCGEVPVVKTVPENKHAQVRCEHCGLAGPAFNCGEAAESANDRAVHYWNRMSMELGAAK